MKKLSQALLVATCLVAASASAATKTSSSSSNVIISQDTDWNDFLNFDKFNGALGQLTSVKVDLYSTITGSVSLTNYNPDITTVPFSLAATVALSRPDSSNLALINSTLFSTSEEIAYGATYIASKTLSEHAGATFSNAQDLALFTGPGKISTLIAANASSSVSADSIDTQFATQASGKGSVTYTYIAAVPEPETYGMLLLGLGVLGVVARRKRATAA